ncbi:MAG: outer membrane beta-barrel protein [Pseudorhodoplanes sp.]
MRFLVAMAVLAMALANAGVASAQNSFNGGYIGLTTGYGWGSSTQTGNIPAPAGPAFFDCFGTPVPSPDDCVGDAKLRTRGGLVGGALGWNAQYGAWIFGVEGDYSYAAVSGDSNACGNIPHSCGSRLESLGTVRGRAGTLFNDWLVYGTGGWAFGRVSGYDVAKLSGDAMYSGWTIGAGIEKRFAPQWSLKLEYLYTDLGGKDLFQASVPGYPEHVTYKLNSLRLGISYFFEPASSPRPIITKGPSLK